MWVATPDAKLKKASLLQWIRNPRSIRTNDVDWVSPDLWSLMNDSVMNRAQATE